MKEGPEPPPVMVRNPPETCRLPTVVLTETTVGLAPGVMMAVSAEPGTPLGVQFVAVPRSVDVDPFQETVVGTVRSSKASRVRASRLRAGARRERGLLD